MGVKVLTDSTCDLPISYYKENAGLVEYVSMPITMNGKTFHDDFGQSMPLNEFYAYLRDGIVPQTSQISPHDFLNKYESIHKQGNSIIVIGLSSGLSGTYNNACMAKDMFLEDHPDAKIDVIDAKCASCGLAVIVTHAVDLIRAGSTHEDISSSCNDISLNVQHWFVVDDLMFLKNGGRVPPALAAIGTLLKIKPVLIVDREGKLKSYQSVRGRKKALKFIVEKTLAHMKDPTTTRVIIGHANCIDDAERLQKYLLKELDVKEVIIGNLSSTIASHVGPDMIGLSFIGDMREHK